MTRRGRESSAAIRRAGSGDAGPRASSACPPPCAGRRRADHQRSLRYSSRKVTGANGEYYTYSNCTNKPPPHGQRTARPATRRGLGGARRRPFPHIVSAARTLPLPRLVDPENPWHRSCLCPVSGLKWAEIAPSSNDDQNRFRTSPSLAKKRTARSHQPGVYAANPEEVGKRGLTMNKEPRRSTTRLVHSGAALCFLGLGVLAAVLPACDRKIDIVSRTTIAGIVNGAAFKGSIVATINSKAAAAIPLVHLSNCRLCSHPAPSVPTPEPLHHTGAGEALASLTKSSVRCRSLTGGNYRVHRTPLLPRVSKQPGRLRYTSARRLAIVEWSTNIEDIGDPTTDLRTSSRSRTTSWSGRPTARPSFEKGSAFTLVLAFRALQTRAFGRPRSFRTVPASLRSRGRRNGECGLYLRSGDRRQPNEL